jgi:glycosyltransferase involved in cell wall biosynthesis
MLSVIIITKNEALNIRRVLESVSFADEIIVMDSQSTDATITIAKEYTPLVFSAPWYGYGAHKALALSYATKPWVLNLDADEVLSRDLVLEIQESILKNTKDAYQIPIRMCFYGRLLKFAASPKSKVRLFKRECGSYKATEIVHEKVHLKKSAKVARLKHSIIHYCVQDIKHAILKMNHYSSQSAQLKLDITGRPQGIVKTFFSSIWLFLRSYFLQLGFLDGMPGLVFAILSAEGAWYKGLKQRYVDV